MLPSQFLGYIPEEQAPFPTKDAGHSDDTAPGLETLDRYDSSRRFYQPRAIRAFSQNPQDLLASHVSYPHKAVAATNSEKLLTHTSHRRPSPHELTLTRNSGQAHSFNRPIASANVDMVNEWTYSESPLQAVAFTTPGPLFRPHRTVTPLPWSVTQEGWHNSDLGDVRTDGRHALGNAYRLGEIRHPDSYAIAEDSYILAETSLGSRLSSTSKDYRDVTPYTFDPSFEQNAMMSNRLVLQAQDSGHDTSSFSAQSGYMKDNFGVRISRV